MLTIFKKTGAALVLIGTLATIAGGYYAFTRGNLSYTTSKVQSLLAIKSFSAKSLEFRLNDNVIDTPYLSEIKIYNAGLKPLAPSAYEEQFKLGKGLELTCSNSSCKILTYEVTATSPPSRLKNGILRGASDKTLQELLITPIGLNPNESIDITLLTDGNPGAIKLRGHITDFTIQETGDFNLDAFTLGVLNFVQTFWNAIGFITTAVILLFFTTIMISIQALKTWKDNYTFKQQVKKFVKNPQDAQRILSSNAEFDSLGTKMNLNMKSSKAHSRLRVALAQIEPATESTKCDVSPITQENTENPSTNEDLSRSANTAITEISKM
jgi:hypothetical protein